MENLGMTEGDQADIDLFLRQGLLSGNRVPVVWGGTFETLKYLHEKADADVGYHGLGMDAIPETTSHAQSLTLPFAVRYLKCSNDASDLCNNHRFCAKCWINRTDVSKDKFLSILPTPPSQVKWHPGWRYHQLKGRVLALSLLDALQAAIQIFSGGTMGEFLSCFRCYALDRFPR
jgi:hypothetical protein